MKIFDSSYKHFINNSELRRIMNTGAIATCFKSEKYTDIENEIMEKGDYKVNVVIDGKREDNEFYKKQIMTKIDLKN